MRSETLEETIRLELERQAKRFGVEYYELTSPVQSWLQTLVMEQLYGKDAPPELTPEASEEE